MRSKKDPPHDAANPRVRRAQALAKQLYQRLERVPVPRGSGGALPDVRRCLRQAVGDIADGAAAREAATALRRFERARSAALRCEALLDLLGLDPAMQWMPVAQWQELASQVSSAISALCEDACADVTLVKSALRRPRRAVADDAPAVPPTGHLALVADDESENGDGRDPC
jgi:hypothetical protein